MKFRRLAILGSLAALAACAETPAPAPMVRAQPAVVAPAPSPTDGSYAGTLARTAGAPRACTASGRATMTVANGRATLAYGPRGAMSATGALAADGALTLAGANAQGGGTVVGNRATGSLRSGDCTYRLALTKAAPRRR